MVDLRRRVEVRIAADESLVSPFDARRARELGACDVAAVKVAKVGGLGAALEIAETMPSYLSSALEGPVGITAAAHAVQALRARGGDAGVAHGLATERLFSTTVGRGAAAEGDRAPSSTSARASASRSTKTRLRRAGSTDLAFAAVDSTNRNTALASAMAEELARCGVRRAVISPGSRSTPLAVALWRQPEIEVTVILDERSAGFFALGTALATGVPAVVLCTSGSAAAEPPPRRRRGRRGGRAADRAHRRPPSGAPRHRRRARRSTSSSSTATRCAGSARSEPTRPTTTACCTSASVACRAYAVGHRRPTSRTGASERSLARAAGSGAGRRRR